MRLPFPTRTITSRPGRRRHPLTGQVMHHLGVDQAVPEHTPLRLDYAGTVSSIKTKPAEGLQLAITIAPKTVVKLNHLAEVLVQPKARIEPGQRIALTGKSGLGAVGAHVCIELWVNGRAVDPETYPIEQKGTT